MKNLNENEWLRDYEDFVQSDNLEVPKELTNKLFSKIQKLINPSAVIVF